MKHNTCSNLVWEHKDIFPKEEVSEVKSDGQVEQPGEGMEDVLCNGQTGLETQSN